MLQDVVRCLGIVRYAQSICFIVVLPVEFQQWSFNLLVLASSAVDCGFESRSGQTKDCKIGFCCFSDKHATLRRKSNQNKNPTQRVGLVQGGPHHHLIENYLVLAMI